MTTTRRTLLASALAVPLATPAFAQAQSAAAWPNRPVRVIVPWPPGGSTDVLCRLLCEQMQARLGQPFTIEAEGLASICLQHEIDHLQGKVFVEHLSFLKRTRIRSKILKAQRESQR